MYEDGSYELIDYKTDRLPKNPDSARNKLRERHTVQLSYYAAACQRMFGRAPRACLIYALALGEAIEITPIPLDGLSETSPSSQNDF